MRSILLHKKASGAAPVRSAPAAAAVLLVLLGLLCTIAASGATFTASLDRETVAVGESATLTLQLEGADAGDFPNLPSIPNLHITSGGTSRNVSIVNGQVSSSISQSLLVTPLQPGEYTIPPLSMNAGGQLLSTGPLKLTAVKAGTAGSGTSGEELAFMKLFIPKKEMFVGEAISVELQVYVRDDVANAQNILAYFDRLNTTPIKTEGFTVLKTAHAQRRRAQNGNAAYTVSTLVSSVVPAKTGNLKLGSIDVDLVLQLPSRTPRQRDGFFDPLGMFQRYEERRAVLSAEPITVAVQPLPKQDVPPTFTGAVGSFTMAASAAPTNVAAGEPITVRIQISGRGALDSLALPDQAAWQSFKTYPPTSKVETTDPLGLQGSKTFEQVVIPQSADIKALPAVVFSYFDPQAKTYKTLAQPAISLVVRPGGSTPAPSIAVNRSAQDNAAPAQDIVHIKQRLGTVAGIQPPLVFQAWFLALQGLPVLALVGASVWRRRTDTLASNPRLRRKRRVAQTIRHGIAELHQLAARNDSDAFFATLFRLLQEQIGERLDLPASAITEAAIDEKLRPSGVPESTLSALEELFQACNAARYAPVKSPQELAAFIPKFEAALSQIREANL